MTPGKGYDSCGRSARLSQEEFGELLDTTRQTVSRRELDQVCPEISKIVMASKRLSVTTDSLLRDGITTFEDDCGEFSCGVYRSSVAEVVQTEKFTLIYYKAPDTGTMGVRLYFGYRAQKPRAQGHSLPSAHGALLYSVFSVFRIPDLSPTVRYYCFLSPRLSTEIASAMVFSRPSLPYLSTSALFFSP